MKLKQDKIGIGCNLRRLRKQLGMTQSQFVVKMQLKGATISLDMYKKMEANRYNIRIYDLMIMKDLLGVDYNEFFKGLSLDSTESES